MAQYCDSTRLEHNWFQWLLGTSVPELEPFREAGLLWTKPFDYVGPAELADPCSPELEHYIALATPHYLRSSHGVPSPVSAWCHRGEPRKLPLPIAIIDLENNSPLLMLDKPFLQQGVVVPRLRAAGFRQETPIAQSWKAMIEDVRATCMGVSLKFKPQTEEEMCDLAHEALQQVMEKLAKRKLVYTPGRAPVFNLLTTTIFRCMYSIKNKDSKHRRNTAKLLSDLMAGTAPRSLRSLRVPGQPVVRAHGW